MKKSRNKIEEFIDSGVKIINIDADNQLVKFVECVVVENGRSKPFFTNIHVKEGEQFQKMLRSKRFKDSIFDPRDRGILLMDVAGYSKHDILYQASILSLFNQAIKHSLKRFSSRLGSKCLEQIIPTGDGCYIIFNACMNDYFLKAAYTVFSEMNKVQNDLIGKYSNKPNACEKMFLRFGCTIDKTDFFIDPNGRRNCYGTGMNEAERILKLGQQRVEISDGEKDTCDSFFIDRKLFDQAEELMSLLRKGGDAPVLSDLGKVSDKHGHSRKIGWLHHLPPFQDIPL